VADGDYERGRGREIGAIAAKLKRLAAAREGTTATGETPVVPAGEDRAAARPQILVLNGWAASPQAWNLCGFMRSQQVATLPPGTTGVSSVEKSTAISPRIFSYVEQLDGEPEKAMEGAERVVLVGWSMGGSSALRLAARWPEKIAGLVLIAATPRMMEEKESGWKGMSPRRLEALRYGVMMTHGEGFFGVPEGKPNPYCIDSDENLARGLKYLFETDVRADLEQLRTTNHEPRATFPVHIFQSERDGIVRAENADYLKKIFPQASVCLVPGTEHALSIFISELIDEAVDSCLRLATAGQDIA
jgi:pimeloyl-ACP methyl ester carboxylesterase